MFVVASRRLCAFPVPTHRVSHTIYGCVPKRGHYLRNCRQIRSLVAAAVAQQDHDSQQGATVAELWSLLRPDWPLVALCSGVTLVSVVASCSVAPALGRVIDVISSTSSTQAHLASSVAVLATVYLISSVTLASQVALSLTAAERLGARLRKALFGRLLHRDMLFHNATSTGTMMSWLSNDVEILTTTVSKLLGPKGVRSLIETVGILCALTWLSPPLAAALLVAAPLISPVVARASHLIKGASKEAAQAFSSVTDIAYETLDKIRIVRLFGAESLRYARFSEALKQASVRALGVIRLQAVLDASSRARNTLCVVTTLILGAHLALAGKVTIGVAYSFFVYAFSFAFALSNVGNTLGDISRAAGTATKTMSVLRRQVAPLQLGPEGESQVHAGLSEGDSIEIEFANVDFQHPDGWELKNINFKIAAGASVALVGPSGGGKSTLIDLLLGIYRPTNGKILINGRDLKDIDLDWWRRHIGVVEQNPGLLSGRLVDVITYGAPNATKEDIMLALRDAAADDFVNALPQGLETVVGRDSQETASSCQLSGGQKQRIALARAFLPNPRVLILDEATSALDVNSEAAVTRGLERRYASHRRPTILQIAHRLSTVRRADWIIVVADGRVVEQGRHEDLLDIHCGVYAGLVATQQL